jgi:hypothetical protein
MMIIEKCLKATVITHFSKSPWLLSMEKLYTLLTQTAGLPDWLEYKMKVKSGCYVHP